MRRPDVPARKKPRDVASLSTILFMIGLAWLVHRFVEMPTHKIGQRIARRLSEGRA